MSNGVVLITGASTGIGAESVKRFAEKGWQAVAAMRKPEEYRAPQGKLPVLALRMDMTERGSIHEAVAETLKRFGRIDVLVNNAGYGLMGSLETFPAEEIERQYRTNVFGLMAAMQEVLPGMRERRSGTIVNISSIGGRMTTPFTAAYNGTKWAVEGISEGVGYELRPFGIRVKVVEPGGIRTDFGTRSMRLILGDAYKPYAAKMLDMYAKRGPSLPGPEKVADTIYRAATDGSARLRYPVHAGILTMRRAMPDWLWLKMMDRLMKPAQAR